MTHRAFERVSTYEVLGRDSRVPAGTTVRLTERWSAGFYNRQLQSSRLYLTIVLSGWSSTPLNAHQIMPDHSAEASRGHGVEFIANKLIQVRPCELKGHGVGRLYINAMIAWARRYHLDELLRPIATTLPERKDSKLIAFYASFGILFPAGSTHHAKASTPVPVSSLSCAATPHLRLRAPPTLAWSSK